MPARNRPRAEAGVAWVPVRARHVFGDGNSRVYRIWLRRAPASLFELRSNTAGHAVNVSEACTRLVREASIDAGAPGLLWAAMLEPPYDPAALIVRPRRVRQVMVAMGTGCLTTLAVLLLIVAAIGLMAGNQIWFFVLLSMGLFTVGGALFLAVTWYAWWSRPLLTADHDGVWARSFRRRNGRFLRWEDVQQIFVRPDGMAYRVLVVVPRPEIGGRSTLLPMPIANVPEDDLLARLRTLSNGRTWVGIMP